MDLFRNTLKIALRRRVLVVAYGFIFLAFHVMNIQSILTLTDASYGWYIFTTPDFGLYGFIFWLFFSLEYLGYAEQVSLSETLDVYYPMCVGSRLWQFAIMLGLILLLVATNAVYQLAAYVLAGMENLSLLFHAMEAVMLNVLMPMILAAMIGAAVSYCRNRTTAYGILAAITIVVSPLLGEFMTVLNYYIDAYELREYVAVLSEPLLWYPDFLYGLTLEDYNWSRILFWCCFLGAFLVSKVCRKRSAVALALCLALVISGAFHLYGFVDMRNSDSIVTLDVRRNGTFSGDHYYWEDNRDGPADSRSEEAAFTVLSYNMFFEADNYLDAEVTVEVTPCTDGDIYKFTLWHGYEIEAVTDQEGSILDYSREGCYLEIRYDCSEPSGQICFRYSGNGNKYYSNDQGIALPGYIPYYPMAGFVDLWDHEEYATIVNTDFPEKEFTVTVNTELPLITNLEQTGVHTYSGTAETVSIFGGFLEVAEEDGYTYMQLLMNPQEADFAAVDAETSLDLSNMVIMLCPEYLGLATGSLNEKYVIFEDHIIVASYNTGILIRVLSAAGAD